MQMSSCNYPLTSLQVHLTVEPRETLRGGLTEVISKAVAVRVRKMPRPIATAPKVDGNMVAADREKLRIQQNI